jgi:hypothetical protein
VVARRRRVVGDPGLAEILEVVLGSVGGGGTAPSYGGACLAALSDARFESARGLAEMPAITLTTLAI